MNEISILMNILSKSNGQHDIGASENDILKVLHITHKNKSIYFQELISNLSNYIEPIGLRINYNPLDDHWFLSHDSDLADWISFNPFEDKPRLAATLFCVLVCCLKNSGIGKLNEIQNIRNKKDILEDIIELQKQGYLTYDDEKKQVKLTPLIGYQLDLEKLFINLSLKLKK